MSPLTLKILLPTSRSSIPGIPTRQGRTFRWAISTLSAGTSRGRLSAIKTLYYKQGDAVATFRVGECQEKLGNRAEARKFFEQYLKILPEGPLAKNAHTALAKLDK